MNIHTPIPIILKHIITYLSKMSRSFRFTKKIATALVLLNFIRIWSKYCRFVSIFHFRNIKISFHFMCVRCKSKLVANHTLTTLFIGSFSLKYCLLLLKSIVISDKETPSSRPI